MRKRLFTLLAVACLTMHALADLPFRLYRYEGFKAHDITPESIVFFGNSITNMHEWWEAFGNPHIVNRGVNGAETPIMLEHLDEVLMGHPAKLFLMMGTNDLGTRGMNTPGHVARSVRQAVRRCQEVSPETQIYVQSILPCTTNGIKRVEDVPVTNDSLRRICQETGVTYVDLYDDLCGIATYAISKDGTHLTMSGYRTWCRKIAPLVGATCTYPDSPSDDDCGLGGISGMRATSFAALPVKQGDILMLGDDGNDWHELLHSGCVKQRGSSWGPRANTLADMMKMVPGILHGRADNGEPRAVCLMLGYAEAAGNEELTMVARHYEALVRLIRQQAPHAAIKLMAVYPSPTASVNASRIKPFNAMLQAMADSMVGVDYVDGTYSRMVKDGVADTDCFHGIYPYARGYARLSQIVAEALGPETGVKPTSEAEVIGRTARIEARRSRFGQKPDESSAAQRH